MSWTVSDLKLVKDIEPEDAKSIQMTSSTFQIYAHIHGDAEKDVENP
jgi:hypothetical protein